MVNDTNTHANTVVKLRVHWCENVHVIVQYMQTFCELLAYLNAVYNIFSRLYTVHVCICGMDPIDVLCIAWTIWGSEIKIEPRAIV